MYQQLILDMAPDNTFCLFLHFCCFLFLSSALFHVRQQHFLPFYSFLLLFLSFSHLISFPSATLSSILLFFVAFPPLQPPYFMSVSNTFFHFTLFCCFLFLSATLFHVRQQHFLPFYSFLLLSLPLSHFISCPSATLFSMLFPLYPTI